MGTVFGPFVYSVLCTEEYCTPILQHHGIDISATKSSGSLGRKGRGFRAVDRKYGGLVGS